jgi:hypothetical protein
MSGVSPPDDDSLEDRLRAIADEISQSLERAVDELDLDEIADRMGLSGERVREFADLAGQWLGEQMRSPGVQWPPRGRQNDDAASGEGGGRATGPHPLDVPTDPQGLALSALDSGRWKVDPGTDELIPVGEGPSPSQPVGLVSELRARDWIAPSGEVTMVGRDALRRWLNRSNPA